MKKIKIGDNVSVIRGKDSGKTGKVTGFSGVNKLLVEGVNMFKKHVKPALTKDNKGGIFDVTKPISLANVILVCPKCSKPTRVGFRIDKDAKRRICKKCKAAIE
jgi:large subunit ribosomal protein L24